ncbi:MAG: hypothetical protein J5871_02615 [Bacteroidales bacterium]|nr:hypothetical protein [Bacteroidales bacterium]
MKTEKGYRIAFILIWASISGLCAYFIVHRAQWCLGDDAIIMHQTGSGIPFSPADTVNPETGRFYPLAYLIYNVLLPFSDGYLPASAHYWLHAAMFALLCVSLAILFVSMLSGMKPVWKYGLPLLGASAMVFKLYPDFLHCFSTIWVSYSLIAAFLLFTWLFHKRKRILYALAALLAVNYATYCLEYEFIIPFSFGLFGLLFLRRQSDRKEKVYYALLLGSGILYLCLYARLVLPHIQSAYDGAHFTRTTFAGNMLRMLAGNKIILLALAAGCIRLLGIRKGQSRYMFFDTVLLAGLGVCCGGLVLRLNWTMYYNLAALLLFPAVVYFSRHYLRPPVAALLLFALVGLHGYRIPRHIRDNQQKRMETVQKMEGLKNSLLAGESLFWYAPPIAQPGPETELRNWRKVTMEQYLGYLLHERDFMLDERTTFEADLPGIWLEPVENQSAAPSAGPAAMGTPCFSFEDITGYRIAPPARIPAPTATGGR